MEMVRCSRSAIRWKASFVSSSTQAVSWPPAGRFVLCVVSTSRVIARRSTVFPVHEREAQLKAANTALKRSSASLTFRHQMALEEHQRVERAQRIKQLREESPYTQAALADKVGVTPRAYQRWEEGGGIEWEHLEKLAEIHDVDVMWIHKAAGRGPTPDPFATESGEESELAEQIGELQSETAELRSELSEVRSDLQLVLSLLRRGEHGQEDADTG